VISARPPPLAAALAAALLAGCAHAPAQPAARAEESPPPVVVAGSRLPQRVDLATGLPRTTEPVRIYVREDLDRTGAPDLARALRELQP
jgi:outer membrane cobalamin receptor